MNRILFWTSLIVAAMASGPTWAGGGEDLLDDEGWGEVDQQEVLIGKAVKSCIVDCLGAPIKRVLPLSPSSIAAAGAAAAFPLAAPWIIGGEIILGTVEAGGACAQCPADVKAAREGPPRFDRVFPSGPGISPPGDYPNPFGDDYPSKKSTITLPHEPDPMDDRKAQEGWELMGWVLSPPTSDAGWA